MSRKKNNIKPKVGIFVLAGVISLFSYTFLLGENQTYFNLVSNYKIKFKSVDGLFTGSVVTINGVPAGNVVAIHFVQKTGEVQAVISILRKFTSVITDQSEASLATKGLLGDKYIAITTKGETGEKLPRDSYITTKPPAGVLGGILDSKGTGEKISAILDELLIFVQSLNSEQTLNKMNTVAHSISTMFSKEKSQNLSQTLKRLDSILKKLDEGEGTAGALINNKSLYNRILSVLGQRPYHQYLPALVNEKSKE